MVTRKYEPRVPEGVDVTRPSIARIYDYLLFGKDNFAADRAAADKLMESRLDPRRLALANRGFLRRAVRFLTRQGVSQFLDLGSGLQGLRPDNPRPGQPAGLAAGLQHRPDAAEGSHRVRRGPARGVTT